MTRTHFDMAPLDLLRALRADAARARHHLDRADREADLYRSDLHFERYDQAVTGVLAALEHLERHGLLERFQAILTDEACAECAAPVSTATGRFMWPITTAQASSTPPPSTAP